MAITELPEDKIARMLKDRLAEIDQLRALPDDLDPRFRRWRERLLALLREGVRHGVVRDGLPQEIDLQRPEQVAMELGGCAPGASSPATTSPPRATWPTPWSG